MVTLITIEFSRIKQDKTLFDPLEKFLFLTFREIWMEKKPQRGAKEGNRTASSNV